MMITSIQGAIISVIGFIIILYNFNSKTIMHYKGKKIEDIIIPGSEQEKALFYCMSVMLCIGMVIGVGSAVISIIISFTFFY